MMSDEHRDARSGEAWKPLDEHATFRLGIDFGFRGAFTRGRPLSREQYEFLYSRSPSGAYFTAPAYEEYLRLYDVYSETCRVRATGLSDREAAEQVRRRTDQETHKDIRGPDSR
jgi:hypothetical protein